MAGPPDDDVPDEAWEDDVCPPAEEEDTSNEEAALVLVLSPDDVEALEDNGTNELPGSAEDALPADDAEETPPAEEADALDPVLVADDERVLDDDDGMVLELPAREDPEELAVSSPRQMPS